MVTSNNGTPPTTSSPAVVPASLRILVGEGCSCRALSMPAASDSELGPMALERAHDGARRATEISCAAADDVIFTMTPAPRRQVVARAFASAQFLHAGAAERPARCVALVPTDHNHRIGEAIGVRVELDHVVAF